ncbi:hypothetical protein AS034_17340 [[Bacillus] enclensis]|nr:hypothetical protein AS034_17340 [[Bacillus] enclensis]
MRRHSGDGGSVIHSWNDFKSEPAYSVPGEPHLCESDPALSQLENVKKEQFVVFPLESGITGRRMAYAVK